MKKLFTLLTLLVAIVTGAQAQTTATFEGDNLNITSSSKTVNGVTLSNNGTDWSYQSGLYAGGGGKTFNLSVANGTISQILITMSGTSNRFTNTNITNCTSCTRDGSVYTLVINPATSTVAVKNNGGGVTVTKIEVTYTLSGPQDPSFTVPSEIVVGETGTITGPSGLNFTATVKSGSEYVSVDGATISANAIGNAVITVSSEAVADTWNEFSQDYNVSVVDEPVTPQPVAGGEYTITFNGRNEGDTDYFTWNSAKHNFNTKFKDATYDGISFTSGLKMEGATQIGFTNTLPATVTIVQSTWSANTIKFDGTELVVNDATAGTGCRVYTVSDVAAGTHSITRGSGESGLFLVKVVESAPATETYTVTFNAGSNGTCATASLTEATPGAGVELPAVTANEGYQFNGWFTAATEGTKVGDAGETYHPTANVEIFAQYSQLAAPSISVTPTAPSTYKGVATTLTANVTGVPDPTVTWYKNTAAATTDGTEVGTGLTYQPDVTTEGTFYYYAVASNSEGTATSQLITLTVTDPDKYITGNAYYMSVDEVAVAGENVYADDITMTIKDYEGGAANADNSVSGINSNYVAQITGTHNGWGTEFVATKNGTLSVGVIINGDKTFTLTNVTSFDYNGVQDEGNNNTSKSAGTNASNTWTPSKKQWTVLSFDVVAGTTYKLSVAGSKMGFFGFEFVPEGTTIPVTVTAAKYATFVPSQAVSFEGSGVKAFAAVYNEATGGATLNEVTAAPAGTPLVVNAEAGTYDLTVVATSETTAPAQNNLKVSDGTVEGDMQTIYGLKNGAKGVGFYPVTQNATIAAGKVYLQIPASEGAREFIGFGGEEVVTGIDAIENGTIDNDAPAYNLAGQKVGKGYKGIVIINGKKVVK